MDAAGTPAWDKWKADRKTAKLSVVDSPPKPHKPLSPLLTRKKNWCRCCPILCRVWFWDLGGERIPHVGITLSLLHTRCNISLGHFALSISPESIGCRTTTSQTRTQSPSTPPLLLLLFTASLCLFFRSRVKAPLTSSHLFTISSLLPVR